MGLGSCKSSVVIVAEEVNTACVHNTCKYLYLHVLHVVMGDLYNISMHTLYSDIILWTL